MIKNDKLSQAFYIFATKAINSILLQKLSPYLVQQQAWFRQDGDTWIRQIQEKPYWGALAHSVTEELKESKEYKDLVLELYRDTIIKNHINNMCGTNTSMQRFQEETLALTCLARHLSRNGITKNKKAILSSYEYTENALYSKKIKLIRLTAINGFDCDKDRMHILPEIYIRKLTDIEISSFLEYGMKIAHYFRDAAIVNSKYGIVTEYFADKVIDDAHVDKTGVFSIEDTKFFEGRGDLQILKSLRLFKGGPISLSATMQFSDTIFATGTSLFNYSDIQQNETPKYYLSSKEQKYFRIYYALLSSKAIEKRKYLNNAITRYNMALERTKNEDKLIDLMIAAESLFLNDQNGELSYRFAHRAAMLTEINSKDRKDKFKILRQIYDIRSQIVHGGDEKLKLPTKQDGTKYTIIELCNILIEMLRKSITIFVKKANENPDDKILIEWDDLLF